MFRRLSIHPIFLVIIGLAGIGLVYQLIVNPLGLIKQIFIAAVMVGVIFAIYKFVMQKRLGGFSSPVSGKYRKAAQQTKKRLFSETSNHLTTKVRGSSQKHPNSKKSSFRNVQATKRKDHNFTVIEGKKGKKKNRAHF